jgi:hypothetical protein
MREITNEDIQISISAAFDSVDLINEGVETPETIERNKEHLRVMIGKEWFYDALTTEQKTQIESII